MVTTTTQLTDFVQVVGGNHVDVYGILKANVDSHDFEPSPGDIAKLAQAKVIVKNGVGLEEWFEPTIRNAESKATIVEAASGVTIRHGQGDHEAEGDPHIWHDPRNAKVMVHNIAVALAAPTPPTGPTTKPTRRPTPPSSTGSTPRSPAQIGGLANKKLVTNHDAFGYYVDRYGLEFVGSIIPSFDSQAELSARDISNIVRLIKGAGREGRVLRELAAPEDGRGHRPRRRRRGGGRRRRPLRRLPRPVRERRRHLPQDAAAQHEGDR